MKASLTNLQIAKAVTPAGSGFFVDVNDLIGNFNQIYEHILKLLKITGDPYVTPVTKGLVGFYRTDPDEKKEA